jgi:Na+-transporting methylmalonyl-CoA/oxaloacetate decarboxylase beta subunit
MPENLLQECISMGKSKRLMKPLMYSLILFTMLGITLAQATLSSLSLQGNYIFLISLAALFALMLLNNNPSIVFIVTLGVIAVNLPESTLANYSLDRDVLLALVCAVIFAPQVYELLSD